MKTTGADLVVNYLSSVGGLAKALARISDEPLVAIDTETTGLDPRVDRVVSIQIGAGRGVLVYLWPVAGDPPDCLRDFLEAPGRILAFHNAAFDLAFLLRSWPDLEPAGIWDTMLAQYLLCAGDERGRLNLAATVREHLGETLDKSVRAAGFVPGEMSDEQIEYAARDADVTYRLVPVLAAKLEAAGLMEIAQTEFEVARVTAEMGLRGIGIDREALEELRVELEERAEDLSRDVQEALEGAEKGPVNLASPKQLIVRFRELGVPLRSSAAAVLRQLNHPAARLLCEHRSVTKLLTAFARPLMASIHPVTGRIHANWRQTGTQSGRFSCAKPNLQQIPARSELGARIRGCFVPRPGYVFVDADYSQIELRLAAEISGDETMIEAYQQGVDLHNKTAAEVLGVAAPSKAERQKAKALNFGLLYGMGAARFQAYARDQYGVEMSLVEAERLRARFFATYPGLAAWHRRTARALRGGGALATRTLAGRRRLFREPRYAELLNTPVQGSGADVLKQALRYLGSQVSIVACLHDEIIVECREEHAEAVRDLVVAEMVRAGSEVLRRVPCLVDVRVSRRWEK